MRIDIQVDFSQFDLVMRQLQSATETTAVLDEASAILLNRVRTRFLDEVDPDNSPWLPSKPGIKRKALGSTGTLWETGTLFRSIQLYGTGPDEREISTDVEYGKYHQEGTKFMVPRVFMGFNEDDADLVEGLILKRIKDALS
jgi:phage gpG-like protein